MKTPNLEKELIEQAKEKALKELGEKILKNIPKTATGFEKDYNSLKRDPESFFKYLKVRNLC